MARDKQEYGYTLPILGTLGLGTTAAGLHGLDQLLEGAGVGRDLKITKDTLDDLKKFVGLRASSVVNPNNYLPEYVERAQAASGAQLFGKKNPLTAAEALNNSVITEAPQRVADKLKWLDRFGSLGKNIRAQIAGHQFSFPAVFEGAEARIRAAQAAGDSVALAQARLDKALASHVLGTSRDYQDAYLRLMDEMAGVSIDAKSHKMFNASRKKGRQIAEDLYEAITNHTAPTREGYKGVKTFTSASEYLDDLWGNTAREGGLHAVPGAYRTSTDIAKNIINSAASKDEALQILSDKLGGNKSLYRYLREHVGTSPSYELVTDAAGKKRLQVVPNSGKRLDKVLNKADALRRGATDLATSLFHGDAARLFTGSAAGHTGDLKKAKLFNKLQAIRNPFLRASLGVGALGSAGLLVHRIKKNKERRNSFLYKLKRLFSGD